MLGFVAADFDVKEDNLYVKLIYDKASGSQLMYSSNMHLYGMFKIAFFVFIFVW